MKKLILILMVVALGVLMSACGQNSAEADTENAVVSQNDTNPDAPVPQGTWEPGSIPFDMPMQTMLILGTFKLEDTDLAVQPEQAQALLPLWQVLNNMMDSETVAVQEIDALVNQIADTMTDEQMQAIEAMGLTMQDLATLTADLGLDEGFQRPEGFPDGEGGFQPPEGMPEGFRPGGGTGGGPGFGPGGGQGGADGMNLSPEEMESLRATRQAEGGGFGMRGGGLWNTALVEALIELLQSK